MSVDILGTNCDQCRSTVQCCFTSTETVRLIRTEGPGRPPRLSHSSSTLVHNGWWWWSRASCPRMSVDILETNCDQCRSTVRYCFTSTETIRLVRTESEIVFYLRPAPHCYLCVWVAIVDQSSGAVWKSRWPSGQPPRLSHSSWTLIHKSALWTTKWTTFVFSRPARIQQ